MKDIVLYTAVTLDGFIAGKDGDIEWLNNFPNPDNLDYGYNDFIKTVSDVIIGRKTYEKMLSFEGPWPLQSQKAYIISRSPSLSLVNENVHQWTNEIKENSISLKQKAGKDIWLMGGGEIVSLFINEGLIDKMILSVIPIVLGEGLPLFPNGPMTTYFDLIDTTAYSTGIVSLTYGRKK